jgi:AraC-like DNA-binding protein
MSNEEYPLLEGIRLFRSGELIFLNRSDESFTEYHQMMHKHDFIEIAYILSGEGIHRVGDSSYEAIKGDLFVINFDTPHGFFAKPGNENPVVYNCVFRPEFLDSALFSSVHFEDITSSFLLKSLFPSDTLSKSDVKLVGQDQLEAEQIFSKMYAEYNGQKKGYYDLLRAFLVELIVKIFRFLEKAPETVVSASNRKLVEKAMDYLRHNYNSDITLHDLALQSFITKNYFSRLFKKVSGISFSDYVQQIRIEEVCRLLGETDMKVLDIALMTGFKDAKFFYETFKKHIGSTPGDYRSGVRLSGKK